MPQSHANVLIHVVFSTKHRTPFLQSAELRGELIGYTVTAMESLKCPSVIVNCVPDHLHCLCHLARTQSVADLVEEMKVSSSKWLKTKAKSLRQFHWQLGYGAFSVSESQSAIVKQYIANQEDRHRRRTYQDEFRLLLRRNGLEWDEKYVWD